VVPRRLFYLCLQVGAAELMLGKGVGTP
jgi:hypothetical protein